MEKVYLYHVIYTTINKNPGITLNQLIWLLSSSLSYAEDVIKSAVETLMYRSEELPRCINYYNIPKEKTKKGIDVVHLRCSDKNKAITEELLTKLQAEYGYTVPELTFKRVTTHAALLKKA